MCVGPRRIDDKSIFTESQHCLQTHKIVYRVTRLFTESQDCVDARRVFSIWYTIYINRINYILYTTNQFDGLIYLD